MKKKSILAWLLILAMLLGMAGCGEDPEPTTAPTTEATEPPTTEPPGPDMSFYEGGIAQLESADNLDLLVKIESTTTISGEEHKEKDTYEILYQGLQGESLVANVKENWTFCGETTEIVYTYADGNTYLDLEGGQFKSPNTTEEFMDLMHPVVPLDASLYQTITVDVGEKETVYTFADPTAAESWLNVEEEEFLSAEATVTIVKDSIQEMTYNVSYERGISTRNANYTFQIREIEPVLELTGPESADTYLETEDILAPLVLQIGYVGMGSSKTKTIDASSDILFYAAGEYLRLQESYNFYGEKTDYIFKS